ncbi:hypothetical protein TNCV_964751 [Trichonephila clavipes]|nr:hypothetical protein TNCV_964751 [Trichonephila clavipes]
MYYQTPYGKPIESRYSSVPSTNPFRLDYGCVVYGSARASVLKRLDTIHHSALRICCGALNFACYQLVCGMPSTTFRTKAEAIKCKLFLFVPCLFLHPQTLFSCHWFPLDSYEDRSFNIKPFSERAKAVLNDAQFK